MHSADSDQEFPEKTSSSQAFSDDEKFELLSAYLDGEITETEYQLVVGWISTDQKMAQHYQKQLRLRQALQALGPAFLSSARTSKHFSGENVASSERASEENPQQNQFSRNVYTPYNPVTSQFLNAPLSNQLNVAVHDLIASNTSWRQGLFVLAVLGATAVTLSTGGLGDKRRPTHLNRFKEPLSGHPPQNATADVNLDNQQPYKSPSVSSIHPIFTSCRNATCREVAIS